MQIDIGVLRVKVVSLEKGTKHFLGVGYTFGRPLPTKKC